MGSGRSSSEFSASVGGVSVARRCAVFGICVSPERVLRRYFPEDFKYEPFGDPFERKRDYEREKRRKTPARPNGATIPPGSYLGSCEGCDMEPGGVLLCQKCQTGVRGQVEEASIDPSACADDEHVGNRHGALICEKKPEVDAPALPRGDVHLVCVRVCACSCRVFSCIFGCFMRCTAGSMVGGAGVASLGKI